MAELYSVGINRIFYKAINFSTGKTVTAYFWNPTMVKSALQTFTEIELGLYYLDYNFASAGSYVGLFYENGVSVVFSAFRVTELATESNATANKNAIIDKINTLNIVGQGTNTILITVYKHNTVVPIPDYNVTFYNETLTVCYGTLKTNSLGQITTNIDSGTYKLKGQKVGYIPDNTTETFTIDPNNLTKTIYATQIDVGVPGNAKTCRVYVYLRNQDDTTIPAKSSIVATAKIKKLPHAYNGSLHKGDGVACTFDANYDSNGLIYWDISWQAVVLFEIIDFEWLGGKIATIPEMGTIDLEDL